MNTKTPVGVHYDMLLADYLAVDALSSTALRLLARSPWHYRNRIEVDQTRPMLRGTLAHCVLLEPDALDRRYVVLPEDAPKRPTPAQWAAKKSSASSQAAKDWWSAFAEKGDDREIIEHEEFEIAKEQLAAVAAQPELAQLLRNGRGEVSIFWIDQATGLYCKARPDCLRVMGAVSADVLDLKTCADESPSGFGRAAARLRYDLQDAHYTAGIEAAFGCKVGRFVFGAVTNKRPVLAVPYVLTDEIRDQGREDRSELMERLAWCLRENKWPAYGQGIQLLDFPAYAKRAGEVEVEWADEGVTA